MNCVHEHLRTVGDRLFCKDCGEELPLEYLVNGDKKPEEKKAPAKKKTVKKGE